MAETPDGFLETGYEATTPVEDTYLRRFVTNWCETNEAIARSLHADTIRTDRFWAADTRRPATYTNTATLVRPVLGDVDGLMAEMESFFTARNAQSRETYVFSPWPTPNFRPFGWRLGGHPPLHILPPGRERPPLPDGFRIERVTTPEQLAAMERVAIEGYPFFGFDKSPSGVLFAPLLLEEPGIRVWLGLEGNRPVGAAVTSIAHGINQVMLIVTLGDVRGRGYGTALTWEASLADPTLPAMLLSSDLGRPVYERMGYLPLLRFTVWYRLRI